jgi:hypothetical protein
MTRNPLGSKAPHVLVAAAIVVVLGGVLTVRVVARSSAATATTAGTPAKTAVAPPSTVPAPHAIDLASLTVPCWGCPGSETWPVRFKTDLDLLAPLGIGPANAAVWFVQFRKPDGPRRPEADAAMARRVEGPGDLGKVLPPNDPLLREAEPWADQATMRFYPNLLPLKGWQTPISNLLLTLTFARSWVARGMAASDPSLAMADFRRAIRLGRLFRQEDAVLIPDLIGLACIRLGAQGIYDLAVKQGDTKLALVAAIVLGEHSAQRLMTGQRMTATELAPYVRTSPAGEVALELPAARLDGIVAAAKGSPDRRFRCEAILQLNAVRFLGVAAQQEKALQVLTALAEDQDPVIAANAAWSRDTRVTREDLRELLPEAR